MKMPEWVKDFSRFSVDAKGAILVACMLEPFRFMRKKNKSIHDMQPEKEHRDCRTEIDPVWDLVLCNTPAGLESTYAPLRLAAGSNLLTYQGSEPRFDDIDSKLLDSYINISKRIALVQGNAKLAALVKEHSS